MPYGHYDSSVSRNGLQTLREALGLNGHLSDSALITISFENTGNEGISDLDVLLRHNLVTGFPSCISRASRNFIFGKSIVIKLADI